MSNFTPPTEQKKKNATIFAEHIYISIENNTQNALDSEMVILYNMTRLIPGCLNCINTTYTINRSFEK